MKLNNLIAVSVLLGALTFDEAVNALAENQGLKISSKQQLQYDDESEDRISDSDDSQDCPIEDEINLKLSSNIQDEPDANSTSIGDLLDDDDGSGNGSKKDKYAGLTSGQIKILKQKEYEEKLRRIAAKIALQSQEHHLSQWTLQADKVAKLKADKLKSEAEAKAQFALDKQSKDKKIVKKALKITKKKLHGEPYDHLLKDKKIKPIKLKLDPKKEAKKSKLEKEADALLKKLALEAAEKKRKAALAKKLQNEEAERIRKLREAKEQYEEDLKWWGKHYTKDEIWTINLPRGWLKGYVQLNDDGLVQINEEEESDNDSADEIALAVQKQNEANSDQDNQDSDDE